MLADERFIHFSLFTYRKSLNRFTLAEPERSWLCNNSLSCHGPALAYRLPLTSLSRGRGARLTRRKERNTHRASGVAHHPSHHRPAHRIMANDNNVTATTEMQQRATNEMQQTVAGCVHCADAIVHNAHSQLTDKRGGRRRSGPDSSDKRAELQGSNESVSYPRRIKVSEIGGSSGCLQALHAQMHGRIKR